MQAKTLYCVAALRGGCVVGTPRQYGFLQQQKNEQTPSPFPKITSDIQKCYTAE